MSRFAAFLDACVLVPIATCDMLLRLADSGAFRPLWSEAVEEEALRALIEIHPTIDPSRFQSRFRNMNEAFEDARVMGWEPLVDGLELPDPNDRRVLAAALRGRADVIVTENIKDFPLDKLESLGIEAMRLDDFLMTQFDLGPAVSARLVCEQAAAMRRPETTPETLLARMERGGTPRFAEAVRKELRAGESDEH